MRSDNGCPLALPCRASRDLWPPAGRFRSNPLALAIAKRSRERQFHDPCLLRICPRLCGGSSGPQLLPVGGPSGRVVGCDDEMRDVISSIRIIHDRTLGQPRGAAQLVERAFHGGLPMAALYYAQI